MPIGLSCAKAFSVSVRDANQDGVVQGDDYLVVGEKFKCTTSRASPLAASEGPEKISQFVPPSCSSYDGLKIQSLIGKSVTDVNSLLDKRTELLRMAANHSDAVTIKRSLGVFLAEAEKLGVEISRRSFQETLDLLNEQECPES